MLSPKCVLPTYSQCGRALAAIALALGGCTPPPTPPGLLPAPGTVSSTPVALATEAAPPTEAARPDAAATSSGAATAPAAATPMPPTAVDSTLPGSPALDDIALALAPALSGLQKPIFLVDRDPTSPGRSFLAVEKDGRIRQAEGGAVRDAPFLDITDRVGSAGSEQGLLGLALHPGFAQNGRFFVDYTDVKGDTQISEFTYAASEAYADPATERKLLHVDQPAQNHNGGMVVFGPDGYLYIGLGDGGGHGDPHRNGQNPGTLLAKILRIDVD